MILLALISPLRSPVLADLDTRFLQNNRMVSPFYSPRKIGDLTVESSVSFPSLPEDTSLCPLECLNTYLTAISAFRISPGHQKLFLSFQKPPKEITRCTIARWLCNVIPAAAIDSSVFKTHSIRTASTSDIISCQTQSTFIKHSFTSMVTFYVFCSVEIYIRNYSVKIYFYSIKRSL